MNAGRTVPPGRPRSFRTTVHGTLFGGREKLLDRLTVGSQLRLIPEYGREPAAVWVHVDGGDPVGHLPEEIGEWLAPWMAAGGTARAEALKVRGPDEPSWKRLVIGVALGEAVEIPPF